MIHIHAPILSLQSDSVLLAGENSHGILFERCYFSFSVGIMDSSLQIVYVRPIHMTDIVSILPFVCAWYPRIFLFLYVKFYSAWKGDHLQVCAFDRNWKCLAFSTLSFIVHILYVYFSFVKFHFFFFIAQRLVALCIYKESISLLSLKRGVLA